MQDPPIAVMSFNRPRYLAKVLASLKAQIPAISEDRVFLFQDGHRSIIGEEIANLQLINACISEFKRVFPGSKVFASNRNLGVALNFDRAEQFFFVDIAADAAIFFEDDMVLSPYYLATVESLLNVARAESRVAYVAAYGEHLASLETQRDAPDKLIPMRHKWGFGLTKRQWLRQRPILEPYLEMVSRADYRKRDDKAVRSYYRALGFGSPGTSQDAMKDVASAILGTTKLMSFVCLGKYIGEIGLHSTSEFYESKKFLHTQLFPEPIRKFEELTGQMLDAWVAEDRRIAREVIQESAAER